MAARFASTGSQTTGTAGRPHSRVDEVHDPAVGFHRIRGDFLGEPTQLPVELVVGVQHVFQLKEVGHPAPSLAGESGIGLPVARHFLQDVRHGDGIAGWDQATAGSPHVAAGCDQGVGDQLGHPADIGTDHRDARSHGLQDHHGLTLVVTGQDQEIEVSEEVPDGHRPAKGDPVLEIEVSGHLPAGRVVVRIVIGGTEDVEMEVGDPSLDQDVDRGDQIDEALDGATRAMYASLHVFVDPAAVISDSARCRCR